jgi:small conductance mechanosensitive channel
MGVEIIGVDTVNLRMVARTLPGKQFEVGRRLRIRIIAALTTAGIATAEHTPTVGNLEPTSGAAGNDLTRGRTEQKS